mmetsp:Transcript_8815/g.18322  ORF Transcript_8815/g.18322 Transcript_8815/m.18322 type:complete len:222 (-) Transcript_8815:458-1123(-)
MSGHVITQVHSPKDGRIARIQGPLHQCSSLHHELRNPVCKTLSKQYTFLPTRARARGALVFGSCGVTHSISGRIFFFLFIIRYLHNLAFSDIVFGLVQCVNPEHLLSNDQADHQQKERQVSEEVGHVELRRAQPYLARHEQSQPKQHRPVRNVEPLSHLPPPDDHLVRVVQLGDEHEYRHRVHRTDQQHRLRQQRDQHEDAMARLRVHTRPVKVAKVIHAD